MSQENVELAYRAFDAFARHDLDVFVAFHDPDCEIQPLLAAVGGNYHGHDGVREWWEDLFGAFPEKGTKTGAERTVRLLSPLAQDLPEWRLAQGRPEPDTIVFPGESSAGTLTAGQWNRWTQGTFRAAKVAVGLPNARAYDLRHSFVSLLIHEGQSILEVARQAGHSPQTCLRDYGHLFDEFDPSEREPAEAVIAAARGSSYLSRTSRRTRTGAKPLAERMPSKAGYPRAGTSGPCLPPMAARLLAGTGCAARAPCCAPARPWPARTGSRRRA